MSSELHVYVVFAFCWMIKCCEQVKVRLLLLLLCEHFLYSS